MVALTIQTNADPLYHHHEPSYDLIPKKNVRSLSSKRTASQPKKRRGKKYVSFPCDEHQLEQIYEIPSRNYYTKNELKRMYLNKTDHDNCQKGILEALKAHQKHQSMTHKNDNELETFTALASLKVDPDFTTRGLEAFLPGQQDRLRRIKLGIDSVIKRQGSRMDNVDDLDASMSSSTHWLSNTAYLESAAVSARLAYQRGLEDQDEIPSSAPKRNIMMR